MPTYEFRCPAGHDFERFFRKISDGVSELPCPQCGKVAERRVSGGAGLLFKGSGFYITDYGKDGKKGQPGAKAASEGGGSEQGSSKGASEGSSAGGGSSDGGSSGGSKGDSGGSSSSGGGSSAGKGDGGGSQKKSGDSASSSSLPSKKAPPSE